MGCGRARTCGENNALSQLGIPPQRKPVDSAPLLDAPACAPPALRAIARSEIDAVPACRLGSVAKQLNRLERAHVGIIEAHAPRRSEVDFPGDAIPGAKLIVMPRRNDRANELLDARGDQDSAR